MIVLEKCKAVIRNEKREHDGFVFFIGRCNEMVFEILSQVTNFVCSFSFFSVQNSRTILSNDYQRIPKQSGMHGSRQSIMLATRRCEKNYKNYANKSKRDVIINKISM